MVERVIVGVGNPSMGDDTVGLKIAERIASEQPEDLEVVSLPGSTLDLLSYLDAPYERVLVVDTALANMEPGETMIVPPDDLMTQKELSSFTSHEGDVLKIIDLAKELEQKLPRIRILGIQPESVRRSLELSDTLQKRFDEYVDMALQVIRADLF